MSLPSISRATQYAQFIRLIIKHAHFQNSLNTKDSKQSQDVKEDAIKLVETIEELGSTFIKLGQLLVTRKTLFPKEILQELTRLQDNVTPISSDKITEIVEEQLGAPIKKVFQDFHMKPIATASLGQVHKAVLRSGQEVVVKIQKPNITKQIQDDIKLLDQSISFLNEISDNFRRYHIQGILDEFKSTIRRELDYTEEAYNLNTIKLNLQEFEEIVFPSPHLSYSTGLILTMDFVKGKKISDLTPMSITDIDNEAIVESIFKAYLKQILVDGFIHSDPHMGNILILENGDIAVIDLGMVTKVGPHMQKELQHLLLAMSEGEAMNAAEIALRLAVPIEGFEDDVGEFKRRIYELIKNDQGKPLQKIKVGEVLMITTDIAAQTGFRFPREFSSIARTLMYLDEIAEHLCPTFNPQESLRRHIIKYIEKSYRDSFSFKTILSESMELKSIVEKLPRKLNTILDDVLNRRLKLRVDVIDEDKLIRGFQKIANRIAAGLILASLIIAATNMMKYESNFNILGYPGLSMILLSLALVGSLILFINVFIRDK